MNIEIDKKIDEYLKGNLTASEIDGLWADILANPEYLGHLKTEAQLKVYFSKNMPEQVVGNTIQLRKSMIVSIAAVTIFVVALAWALLLDTGVHPPQAINSIDVFDMETPAVTRSENDLIVESGRIVLEGFDLVLDGNDLEAMSRFREVIENYPDSESAVFARLNLGIIAYNTRDFDSALSHFESASAAAGDTDVMIRQKILWFTANAALLAGDMETAAGSSQDASLINGYYTEQASEFYGRMQAYLNK